MGSEKVGYVEALRRKIGHDPVIMTCAGCAVFDGAGRLLLQQRGDVGGPWGLPGGAVVVVLTATPVEGRLTEDGIETVGLGWFTLDDLPSPIFAPHQEMLDDLRN